MNHCATLWVNVDLFINIYAPQFPHWSSGNNLFIGKILIYSTRACSTVLDLLFGSNDDLFDIGWSLSQAGFGSS